MQAPAPGKLSLLRFPTILHRIHPTGASFNLRFPSMADEPLAQQLLKLRELLDDVDSRLARAPVVPAGLEELKRSVDTLRTNMWAILSAGHGATASVRIERLKLRRALEGLK